MIEPDVWSLAMWEGNRRRQHQEFLALPFAEKIGVIEGLADLARAFDERRAARGLPIRPRPSARPSDGGDPG